MVRDCWTTKADVVVANSGDDRKIRIRPRGEKNANLRDSLDGEKEGERRDERKRKTREREGDNRKRQQS
jgi:hypothetical protein